MTDARVPVLFGPADAAEHTDALLFEGDRRPFGRTAAFFLPAFGHAPGCACCIARSDAARALVGLLHARARNQVPFFRRVIGVIATEQGRADVEASLANDPVVSACFKRSEV